jgi:hypothetical protein
MWIRSGVAGLLAQRTGRQASSLAAELSLLEIDGSIARFPGGRFLRLEGPLDAPVIVKKTMPSHLLIVESPSKAKTLKKYLGKDYEILASYGHVRDLVPKTGAVDPEDNFRMKYELIDREREACRRDREGGEDVDIISSRRTRTARAKAIAWHLVRDPQVA